MQRLLLFVLFILTAGTLTAAAANNRANPRAISRAGMERLSAAMIHFPDKAISNIDTATTLGTNDSTRDVYSYDGRNVMTSDMSQKYLNGAWVNYDRISYTFDGQGRWLSFLYEVWDGTGWQNDIRYATIYDAQNNLLNYLREEWSNAQWANIERYDYTYDGNRNQLSEMHLVWTNAKWDSVYLFTYTYDAAGNLLNSLGQNRLNGQWANAGRKTYTYDSHHMKLSQVTEAWQNGQWILNERAIFTYNANEAILFYSDFYTDGQTTDSLLNTYTYDANGNKTVLLERQWLNGQYTFSWRHTYTYDQSGDMLTDLYDTGTNGSWFNAIRHTYAYDAKRSLISDNNETWDNNAWGPNIQQSFAFDENENIVSMHAQRWVNAAWVPFDQYLTVLDSAGDSFFYLGYSVTLARHTVATGVVSGPDRLPSQFTLLQNYPNPFNPTTTISFDLPIQAQVVLKVYNMLGQEVAAVINGEQFDPGDHAVQFDASRFSSGVYTYRIEAISEDGKTTAFTQVKRMILVK